MMTLVIFDQRKGIRYIDCGMPDLTGFRPNGEDGNQIARQPSHNLTDNGIQQVRPQKQADRAEDADVFSCSAHSCI